MTVLKHGFLLRRGPVSTLTSVSLSGPSHQTESHSLLCLTSHHTQDLSKVCHKCSLLFLPSYCSYFWGPITFRSPTSTHALCLFSLCHLSKMKIWLSQTHTHWLKLSVSYEIQSIFLTMAQALLHVGLSNLISHHSFGGPAGLGTYIGLSSPPPHSSLSFSLSLNPAPRPQLLLYLPNFSSAF